MHPVSELYTSNCHVHTKLHILLSYLNVHPLQADPIRLPPAFQSVKQWLLFSDLHVSRANCSHCMEVLQRVHQHAVDR